MRSRLAGLTVALCLLASPAQAVDLSHVVPPDESAAGKTQAEWAQAWWQWFFSFDWEERPSNDPSGEFCHLRQHGPVWFLAGMRGPKLTERTCKVPFGKYIYFPIVTYIHVPRTQTEGGASGPIGSLLRFFIRSQLESQPSCEAQITRSKTLTDQLLSLQIMLDGHIPNADLKRHRQATGCFDAGVHALPQRQHYPSAANGYWIMLKPLPRGKHEVHFNGNLSTMVQAVTYTLIVE